MNDANKLKTPNVGEAYLVPVFVTEQEEAYLLTKVEELGGTPVEEGQAESASNGAEPSPRKFKSKVRQSCREGRMTICDLRVYYVMRN